MTVIHGGPASPPVAASAGAAPIGTPYSGGDSLWQALDAQFQVEQLQAAAIEGAPQPALGLVPGVNAPAAATSATATDAASGAVGPPPTTVAGAPAGFEQKFGAEAGNLPPAGQALAAVPQKDVFQTIVVDPSAATAAKETASSVRGSFPIDGLTSVGASASGQVFQVGNAAVAGMEIRVRQIVHPTEGNGAELSFRLTPSESRALAAKFDSNQVAGATKQRHAIEKGTFENGVTKLDPNYPYTPASVQAWQLKEPGKFSFDFVPGFNMAQAYRDRVRLRVFGATDGERKANLGLAMQKLGLESALADADPVQTERLRRLSVLRMVAPKQAETLGHRLREVPLEEIDAALTAAGVHAARLQKVRLDEVFPGHIAPIDPALGEEYAKHGVLGIMVGVGAIDRAVNILTSDGLMSSTERYGRGLHAVGSSMAADEGTGGAEFAFTRLITLAAVHSNYGPNVGYAGGIVQLVSTGDNMKRQLSRTDWHAYPADKYGISVTDSQADGPPPDPFAVSQRAQRGSLSQRLVGKALVDAIGVTSGYQYSNEACFKNGVPAAAFDLAVVQSETYRTQLIAELEKAGIKSLGGKPLQERVVTASAWNQIREQLGYVVPEPVQAP